MKALPVALCLLASLAACTSQQTESFENAMWQVFAGHPKPVVYREPPPPSYCYKTLGDVTCYVRPRPGDLPAEW